MRFGLAFALALALVLAGCAAPAPTGTPGTTPTPGPTASATESGTTSTTPSPTPAAEDPWTALWDDPWAARTVGYGFIARDRDGFGPPVPAIAVDHAGHVLRFNVSYDAGGHGRGVDIDGGSMPWRGPVEEVLAPGVLFPAGEDHRFRVTDAAGATLPEAQWDQVRQRIQHGIDTGRDPQANQGPHIADGGSRLLFADGRGMTLDDNHDDGGGWGEVEDELVALLDWMDG